MLPSACGDRLALPENGQKDGPCADIVPTGCVVTASCPLLNMQTNPRASGEIAGPFAIGNVGMAADAIGLAFED
jgi:hypothetical protein